MTGREPGFTLIEVLVVLAILGLLAAIAVPTFVGFSDRAARGTVHTDLRNAATAMEIWRALSDNGLYPTEGELTLPRTEPDVTLTIVVPGVGDDGQEFCIEGAHGRLDGGTVVATYDQRVGGLTDDDSC